MKKIALLLWVLTLLLIMPEKVWGQEFEAQEFESLLESQMDALPLYEVDKHTKEGDLTFRQWVEKVISGELMLSPAELANSAFEMIFFEIRSQLSLVKKLLLIVLLSAVLKNINASFQGKSVGEMGFYVCYMVLIVLIVSTFATQTAMVVSAVSKMTDSFLAMVPIFVALAASSGGFAQSAVMGPMVMGGAGLLSVAIKNGILPAISLGASLEMVSNITERPMLGRFTSLLKGGIGLCMKAMAFLFMALMSLQKIGSAPLNTLAGKTAKAAIGAIPVVGDVMGGAVETAAALAGTLKSGFMVAAVIFLAVLCILPLIKLGVMALIYKLTAAAAEPICEGRLVKCISAAGDFSVLLFGALFLADVMFTFSAILLLAAF